jgi:hypothetical protein
MSAMTDLEFCYDMLYKTSRSFAAVIDALGTELKDAVGLAVHSFIA